MAISVLLSPSRYVQGKNALGELGTHIARIGKNPLVVSDDIVWGLVEETVTAAFKESGLESTCKGRRRTC